MPRLKRNVNDQARSAKHWQPDQFRVYRMTPTNVFEFQKFISFVMLCELQVYFD